MHDLDPAVMIVSTSDSNKQRLDIFLTRHPQIPSRSVARRLIDEGKVLVNGAVCKPSYRTSYGDQVEVYIPRARVVELEPQDIPLDIIYEDEDLLLVNKPAGMVVHPAPGNETGTLVNALLAHCQELSQIGGIKRPGIVHRLDKDTSGLLIVAKNDRAHMGLAEQMKLRTVRRVYWALVQGQVSLDQGKIEAPIGRHFLDRRKMAVRYAGGRNAITYYYVKERFCHFTRIDAQIITGRTHQIRVHLAFINHPIVGDTKYGGGVFNLGLQRQALHAAELEFTHPCTGKLLRFNAPLPEDLKGVMGILRGPRSKEEQGC
ncbi:MAG: RluA family pseudouridine synthase [Limnochordia bacterium]|nr:RluA family pseudouridine synthase [Limnochordia bacterium]MDD2629418.1 RluA family pseudouridine synthase [Limnochordia bacterium]